MSESKKFDAGKIMIAWLPIEATEAVCRVLNYGAAKYGNTDNWRVTGFPYRRILSAALRHVFAFLRGEDNDPETGESHLAHAICCLLFCLTFILEGRSDLDDRYKSNKVS